MYTKEGIFFLRFVVSKGDVIISQGFMNDYFYQIIEGTVETKITDKETKETQIVDILNPGEIFGEISFLLGLVSHVTIRATTDVLVVAVLRSKLEKFIMDRPEFGVSLYKFLARNSFTRLHQLQFIGQSDIEKTPILAPILDQKTMKDLGRAPLPLDSPALRKRHKDSNPNSRTSSPLAKSSVPIAKTKSEENSPTKPEKILSQSVPAEITFTPEKIKPDPPASESPPKKEWIAVSKRSSPTTAPRRGGALMSRRVRSVSNTTSSDE